MVASIIPTGETPEESFFLNKTDKEWLTTEEASRYLAMTENALRILVHRGRVKAFKLGRRLRFRFPDLRVLLQRKEPAYG